MPHETPRAYRQRVALLATAAAIVLAGCGGAKAPSVANLATTTATASGTGGGDSAGSGRGTSAGGRSGSDLARLLDDWAACMRAHGDPNQADPSIDSHKDIVIPWDPAVPGGYNGTNKGGQGNAGPGQYCRTYLSKAQNALRGGRPQERPSTAQLVQFSECMRAHGIRDFPDPTANGLQMNMGGDLSPSNPAFRNASRTCSQKTGVQALVSGTLPPGVIRLTNP
jgi:hypothetical protein